MVKLRCNAEFIRNNYRGTQEKKAEGPVHGEEGARKGGGGERKWRWAKKEKREAGIRLPKKSAIFAAQGKMTSIRVGYRGPQSPSHT